MPEDLRGGATLPLPDVTSSDWLEGIAAKGNEKRDPADKQKHAAMSLVLIVLVPCLAASATSCQA